MEGDRVLLIPSCPPPQAQGIRLPTPSMEGGRGPRHRALLPLYSAIPVIRAAINAPTPSGSHHLGQVGLVRLAFHLRPWPPCSSPITFLSVLQHGLLPDCQQPRPHPGISKTTQQLDGIYALFVVLRLAVVDTKADGAILKEKLWTLIAQNEPSLISLQLLGGEKVVYDATKKIFSSSSGLAEDILFLFTDWLSLLGEIVNIERRVHT
ncbi:uncharacterized protein [Zea mays]|uniref:uncharacterized protein n=1 Tax=Zea mays TaxID=4577 RepID=UPI0009A9A259|nr:uncharacterized protein LOC103641236 [Zea mays]|eukprot:XP_020401509.1 uncharacterized protein LOC103641236 [Zea mays]